MGAVAANEALCLVLPRGTDVLLALVGLTRTLASNGVLVVLVVPDASDVSYMRRVFSGCETVRFWIQDDVDAAVCKALTMGLGACVVQRPATGPWTRTIYATLGADPKLMYSAFESGRRSELDAEISDLVERVVGPSFVLVCDEPGKRVSDDALPRGIPRLDFHDDMFRDVHPLDRCVLFEKALEVHVVDGLPALLADLTRSTARAFCHHAGRVFHGTYRPRIKLMP